MKKLLLISSALLILLSCKKDEDPVFTPPPTNENEVITSAELVFTDTENNEIYSWLYSDIDGDGGNQPVITADTLPANRSFSMTITLLNETENPVEDITTEIEDEADDHQFFFVNNNDIDITFEYADTDNNGFPVGLENTVTTGQTSTGDITVVLRHLPEKSAENVSEGDISNAGGGTDLEITFGAVID